MLEQLKDIQNGFTNLVLEKLNLLDESIHEEGVRRHNICMACPIREGNKCSRDKRGEVVADFTYYGEKRYKGQIFSGCSCNLSVKVVSEDAQCPLGRWLITN